MSEEHGRRVGDSSIGELNRSIGRLESKVDTLLENQKSLNLSLTSHDARLRDLEHHKSYFLGIAAAVGSAAALLVEVIKNKLFG
jgi:hypothetical protein